MNAPEILPGFRAFGLTLSIPDEEALAFADVHLGFEEALNRQGVMVPRFQYRDLSRNLNACLKAAKPRRVIVDGDLKHEFGLISPQEWSEVLRFLDGLKGYDVTLVSGNHDTILGPIAARGEVRVVEELRLGTTLFVHGHREPKALNGVKTIVMGHEHPCVSLAEDERRELVKCFLVGRWRGIDLIVLPSINLVTEGVDVLSERLLSPLLQGDIGGFKAWGVDEGRVMEFGIIDGIRHL
jgi:uncharacterized protein